MSKKEAKTTRGSVLFVVLLVLLLAVLGFSLYKIIPYVYSTKKAERQFTELTESFVKKTVPEKADPEKEEPEDPDAWWWRDVSVDVAALQKINPDVMGWIRFDDTAAVGIDYPVLAAEHADSYLRRDMYGEHSLPGSIFSMDEKSLDLEWPHTLLYGHNMRDGSMFSALPLYEDQEFWEANRYFTVYTAKAAYRYEIFACFTADVTGDVYLIQHDWGEEYEQYVKFLRASSAYDTGVRVRPEAYTMTLSTCTDRGYDWRYTVHAVCIEVHEYED